LSAYLAGSKAVFAAVVAAAVVVSFPEANLADSFGFTFDSPKRSFISLLAFTFFLVFFSDSLRLSSS